MGIFADLIPVWIAHGVNCQRNHISRRMIDFIRTKNLIICGGNDIVENNRGQQVLTLSGEFKTDAFISTIEEAENQNRNVLCFYNTKFFPGIDLDSIQFKNTPIVFGVNATYSPLSVLDANTKESDIYCFFERIAKEYFGNNNATDLNCVVNTIKMIINILSSIGSEYITIDNISILANDLFKYNEKQFKRQVENRTGVMFSEDWKDYLTLEWDMSKTKFRSFWLMFTKCLEKYTVNGMRNKESLYSILSQKNGKVCFCGLDLSDRFLKSVLLSELEMIYGNTRSVKLIDYHIPLPIDSEHRFLSCIDICMIGDSFNELGIERMIYTDPNIVCLGVNRMDASDILESMVSVGRWIRTTGGYGFRPGHLDIHFSRTEIRPITEDDLSVMRIREGSAMRIDRNGYTFVDNIFI